MTVTRRQVIAIAIGLIVIQTCTVMLSACTGLQPEPFKTGVEVAPPYGCIDYRARGGQC